MQLNDFIQWTIRHNALIIESLIAVIVLFVLLLAYRTFLSARSEEKNPQLAGPEFGNLEATLKKILEQASALPAAGSAAAGNNGALLAEIAELRQSLETKQAELELAKAAGDGAPAASSSGGGGDSSELLAQIEELKSKLSEYEIISEDIADLSFYKEENVKLQKELEFLKNSAPAVTAAPVAAEPPKVEVPQVPVVEPSSAKIEEPPTLAPAQAQAEASSAAAPLVDDDIMAEFAAAISEQLSNKESTSTHPVSATTPVEAPEPTTAVTAEVKEDVDLGNMDLDKMQTEATTLETASVDIDTNALESELDPSKLLAEAESMESSKAQNDAQLMGEFENFVKKES